MVLVTGAIDRAALAEKIAQLLPEEIDYFLVFKAESVKPSLCIGYLNGSPVLPNTTDEVDKATGAFDQSSRGASTHCVGHYDLIVDGREPGLSDHIDFEKLALVLDNFLFNNLNFFNYIEDVMASEIEHIQFESLYSMTSNYDAFAATISEQFSVRAEILRANDDDGPITSLCHNCVFTRESCSAVRGHILHALDKAQVIEAVVGHRPADSRVEAGAAGLYRYIFPIRSKSKGIIQSNEFMMVEDDSGGRISVLKAFSINHCVEEYAYTRVRLGQRKCLHWQTNCVADLIESVDNARIDQSERFRIYIAELAQFILSSTQGHSFAYLSYDASKEALSRVVATFEPLTDELEAESDGPTSVPLKEHSHYISAHLFERQSLGAERDIYLRSIRNRAEWSRFGLESVRCRRNSLIDEGLVRGARTQSEAAFIIHDQGMPVGVICVECPYRDGLANDLDFLRQIASNASIYRSFLFRVGDQRWLRRNLKLQDVAHELEKLSLAIKDQEVRNRLTQITGDLAHEPDSDDQGSRTLVERIDNVVLEEVGSAALLAEMGQPVKVFNPPRHDVPHSVQMAAIHIIRILLQNRLHEPKDPLRPLEPASISVVTRDSHAGVRNALLIRTTLRMNLPESEIHDAFRRPIQRADREHVGLYLIGVLVRAWGGRLDFDRSSGSEARKLEICIPFQRFSGGSINEPHSHSYAAVRAEHHSS